MINTLPKTSSPPKVVSPLNIPNALTSIRILAIPGIILLMSGHRTALDQFYAACLFGFAFWTDFFDGMLARHTQQITRLGKVLDPIADKLLVMTAIVLAIHLNYLDVWVAILLLGREMSISGLRALASAEGKQIPSSLSARTKTFFEGFGLGFLLLGPENRWLHIEWMELGRICLYIGLGLALWSGAIYFRDYFKDRLPSQPA